MVPGLKKPSCPYLIILANIKFNFISFNTLAYCQQCIRERSRNTKSKVCSHFDKFCKSHIYFKMSIDDNHLCEASNQLSYLSVISWVETIGQNNWEDWGLNEISLRKLHGITISAIDSKLIMISQLIPLPGYEYQISRL